MVKLLAELFSQWIGVRIIGHSKLPVGVNVRMNYCLLLHISPVMNWWLVQGVPHLTWSCWGSAAPLATLNIVSSRKWMEGWLVPVKYFDICLYSNIYKNISFFRFTSWLCNSLIMFRCFKMDFSLHKHKPTYCKWPLDKIERDIIHCGQISRMLSVVSITKCVSLWCC